ERLLPSDAHATSWSGKRSHGGPPPGPEKELRQQLSHVWRRSSEQARELEEVGRDAAEALSTSADNARLLGLVLERMRVLEGPSRSTPLGGAPLPAPVPRIGEPDARLPPQPAL
ncbi:unnamed protein product, partial [Prorocentrum cordatum]